MSLLGRFGDDLGPLCGRCGTHPSPFWDRFWGCLGLALGSMLGRSSVTLRPIRGHDVNFALRRPPLGPIQKTSASSPTPNQRHTHTHKASPRCRPTTPRGAALAPCPARGARHPERGPQRPPSAAAPAAACARAPGPPPRATPPAVRPRHGVPGSRWQEQGRASACMPQAGRDLQGGGQA